MSPNRVQGPLNPSDMIYALTPYDKYNNCILMIDNHQLIQGILFDNTRRQMNKVANPISPKNTITTYTEEEYELSII